MARRIITISREYGSGGRFIGQMVANLLGYKFYDKELMRIVAQESGMSLEYVEENSEQSTTSLLYNLYMASMSGHTAFTRENLPPSYQVYMVQSQVIKKLASEGPCVIIGRSSNFILRERDDCLNVFIHADMRHKIERAVQYYGIPEDDAERLLRRKDKARANHCKHYTEHVWGMAHNYHISLDSGLLGVDVCRDIIATIARDT